MLCQWALGMSALPTSCWNVPSSSPISTGGSCSLRVLFGLLFKIRCVEDESRTLVTGTRRETVPSSTSQEICTTASSLGLACWLYSFWCKMEASSGPRWLLDPTPGCLQLWALSSSSLFSSTRLRAQTLVRNTTSMYLAGWVPKTPPYQQQQ